MENNIEKKEVRTLLTESSFSNLCKIGSVTHNSIISGKMAINFTNADIRGIISGRVFEKEVDDATLKFLLQDIGVDMIREILRRSPLYSEISYEL